MNEMGRIPQAGEEVRMGGWRVTMMEMDGNRPASSASSSAQARE